MERAYPDFSQIFLRIWIRDLTWISGVSKHCSSYNLLQQTLDYKMGRASLSNPQLCSLHRRISAGTTPSLKWLLKHQTTFLSQCVSSHGSPSLLWSWVSCLHFPYPITNVALPSWMTGWSSDWIIWIISSHDGPSLFARAQAHHCAATSGCSGKVPNGSNCKKCKGYSKCVNDCGNFVLDAGDTCPKCDAKGKYYLQWSYFVANVGWVPWL